MSVDKFGRHQTSTLQARLRGPPGVGFKTTAEGDYDMNSKRLRMVGKPQDVDDAVTVNYINDNCLQLKKADETRIFFDASKQVIRNLKEPVENSDAVNKIYIDERIVAHNNDGWDFRKSRLLNVGEPKSSTDAVNKAYVEKQVPARGTEEWNFNNMRLSNIAAPMLDNDSVNLSFLKTHVTNYLTSIKETALALDTTNDVYDAKGKCITNMRDAVSENDAVNLHILNAFRENIETKLKDMWNQFEDEMSSLAYYLAHRFNDPLNRQAPTEKQRPWRNNFPVYTNLKY